MTTPPKRFPLALAEVMARRQRKAPALDKASRASPAGAPPAAMTRTAMPTSQGSGKAPAAASNHAGHNGLRPAATPMAGASARPGGAHAAHALTPKGLSRPASAPHVQPAPHGTKAPPRPAAGGGSKGGAVGADARARVAAPRKTAAAATARAGTTPPSNSPDGIGLTSERVRARMAERVAASGVKHAGVLAALATVPRHGFVDAALANQAYEDAALPIGHGQTISKPSVVGRMIELLLAGGRTLEKVLEIGTGCGYQAAVLSCVAREVYSIERVRPLHERAKANLRPLRVPNIRLHYGDGRLGLPAVAPFDGIVIAAAGLEIPDALLDQLAVGARLVAPVGGEQQILTLIERVGARQWRETQLDRVLFVPLKSGII
ncbi:protein-L-isoaspartate(D-aspartate) O-methyltransferase [Pandoraea nosoerga]|uniref:Protein-L-isoaspartate O-methyltransferase n=1 Tax=Pandoraea nosoerga TaxID=2508296 RepID=A0A5E4X975_9BURK|nr:protein-L-isoaspartate(D-aspartate) O-methyltransferase [Pandoraea nosoerga]MBN4665062.1 protein-L-isoaspartate(D-aspartate) O-methyltransferase [Pandoraea nosoerga]MBN4675222.1 protein-L-isoaspartate(D-aspartate) O-methyltransferase [Pandoraea nosoerga]MBN4680805.1 protein-L-isoaspartate(D-aspartate) O-methyltransferase [Pandoraea nosoerga]MBN4744807.1 protein-L-isoaspartate(D-aspartate) O-methyltransferase [Pandoraea nosoerga]VVE32857.1 protein-L-isoaspartate O-methyltransferase [Pandorae